MPTNGSDYVVWAGVYIKKGDRLERMDFASGRDNAHARWQLWMAGRPVWDNRPLDAIIVVHCDQPPKAIRQIDWRANLLG